MNYIFVALFLPYKDFLLNNVHRLIGSLLVDLGFSALPKETMTRSGKKALGF